MTFRDADPDTAIPLTIAGLGSVRGPFTLDHPPTSTEGERMSSPKIVVRRNGPDDIAIRVYEGIGSGAIIPVDKVNELISALHRVSTQRETCSECHRPATQRWNGSDASWGYRCDEHAILITPTDHVDEVEL